MINAVRYIVFFLFGWMMTLPFDSHAQAYFSSVSFDVEQELKDCNDEFFRALDDVRSYADQSEAVGLRQKLLIRILRETEERKENTRLVASILTLTLGPFGAHRLYLGTEAIVPVFYTVTLGGGLGILPVVDLFHILLTKDLSRFYNNGRVFMW